MQILNANSIHIVPMIRQAAEGEIAALTTLMHQSVRALNTQDYSHEQVESAIKYVFSIDAQLIADGTYYVAEVDGEIAACGGWSRHAKLFGRAETPDTAKAALSSESSDAAKIRAFFVHPKYARKGIGRRLIQMSELAARRAGFRRLELVATLTGEKLYIRCGFRALEDMELVMPNGVIIPAVKMEKRL